jgi:hypothetical protein
MRLMWHEKFYSILEFVNVLEPKNRFRHAENRFLGSLKGLQIRALMWHNVPASGNQLPPLHSLSTVQDVHCDL